MNQSLYLFEVVYVSYVLNVPLGTINLSASYICLSSRIWLMMHSFLNYYCRVIIALICRLCMSPTVPYA